MEKSAVVQLQEGFRKHFGRAAPVDEVMAMAGVVSLDVVAVDAWLHQVHGNYEDEKGMSMSRLVVEKYGKEAEEFVRSWLAPRPAFLRGG